MHMSVCACVHMCIHLDPHRFIVLDLTDMVIVVSIHVYGYTYMHTHEHAYKVRMYVLTSVQTYQQTQTDTAQGFLPIIASHAWGEAALDLVFFFNFFIML